MWGMIEPRQQLGFAGEALRELRVPFALGREDLERDEAVQRFLSGLVDNTHSAATEAFEDLELRETRADLFHSRRRGLSGRFIGNGPRLKAQFEKAAGAEPGGDVFG